MVPIEVPKTWIQSCLGSVYQRDQSTASGLKYVLSTWYIDWICRPTRLEVAGSTEKPTPTDRRLKNDPFVCRVNDSMKNL